MATASADASFRRRLTGGFAVVDGDDDVDSALDEANSALYQAKREGRGGSAHFSDIPNGKNVSPA